MPLPPIPEDVRQIIAELDSGEPFVLGALTSDKAVGSIITNKDVATDESFDFVTAMKKLRDVIARAYLTDL